MIIKRFKEFLKEDPDQVSILIPKNFKQGDYTISASYGESKSRSFGFIGDKFIIGNVSYVSHSDIVESFLEKIIESDNLFKKYVEIILKTAKNNIKNYRGTGLGTEKMHLAEFEVNYNKLTYVNPKNKDKVFSAQIKILSGNVPGRLAMIMPGRLWVDKKVISFWIYPQSIKEINKLISALSKKGIKIDDDWWIDLSRLEKNDFTGIKYKEYKSSKEIKSVNHDLAKIHTMSPEQKKKLMSKVRGFGSDKEAAAAKEAGFDTAAEWRFKTTIGDCMLLGKFKEILNEKI